MDGTDKTIGPLNHLVEVSKSLIRLVDHTRYATHVIPHGELRDRPGGELRDREPLNPGELRDR